MKKIFTSFIIFIMAITLAAETGYKGFQWWETTKKEVSNQIDITLKRQDEQFEYYANTTRILTKSTEVYYSFFEGILTNVSYVLDYSQEMRDTLLSRFNKPTIYRSLPLDTFNCLEVDDNYVKENTLDIITGYSIITTLFEVGDDEHTSIISDAIEYGQKEKTSDMEMFIIDYNQDTRVYIFSNFIKGSIIVIYTPHAQDF